MYWDWALGSGVPQHSTWLSSTAAQSGPTLVTVTVMYSVRAQSDGLSDLGLSTWPVLILDVILLFLFSIYFSECFTLFTLRLRSFSCAKIIQTLELAHVFGPTLVFCRTTIIIQNRN